MVIEGHVQTSYVIVAHVIEQDVHQFSPVYCTVCFKSTAAGAGHIHADTHVFRTVVQDGDILEEVPALVTIPALLHLLPGHILQAQQLHDGLRAVRMTGKGEPVEQDQVFFRYYGFGLFHNFLPLVCRLYPPVSAGGSPETQTFPANMGYVSRPAQDPIHRSFSSSLSFSKHCCCITRIASI